MPPLLDVPPTSDRVFVQFFSHVIRTQESSGGAAKKSQYRIFRYKGGGRDQNTQRLASAYLMNSFYSQKRDSIRERIIVVELTQEKYWESIRLGHASK